MSVTIKAIFDGSNVRAGMQALASEGRVFRDTFKKNIESGGGLFGSIDSALGKLAGGRFAAPIAAVGASLVVMRGVLGGMVRQWENMDAASARMRENVEAISATRDAVASASRAGDSANVYEAMRARMLRATAEDAARQGAELGDPSTFRGAARTATALNNGERGMGAAITFLRLTAGRFDIPFFGDDYAAANQLYQDRQQTVYKTRQEADRAQQLRPFVEFANRTDQRSAQATLVAAEDRLGMVQGRTTAFEAAANRLLFANAQYEDTAKLYGAEDPRTLSARASALDAFASYDAELSTARRFRNDPTIAADSLARLGGGGSVNVFGDGRGELLFEQKRLNQSAQGLIKEIQALNVTLSKGFNFDVN